MWGSGCPVSRRHAAKCYAEEIFATDFVFAGYSFRWLLKDHNIYEYIVTWSQRNNELIFLLTFHVVVIAINFSKVIFLIKPHLFFLLHLTLVTTKTTATTYDGQSADRNGEIELATSSRVNMNIRYLPISAILHLVAILKPILILVITILKIFKRLNIFDFIKYLAEVFHKIYTQCAYILKFYKLE